MNELYADAGIISWREREGGKAMVGHTPLGGSWAWRRVMDVERPIQTITEGFGLIVPEANARRAYHVCDHFFIVRGQTTISSPLAELWAILHAIQCVPPGDEEYILCSDCEVAIEWAFGSYKRSAIPGQLLQQLEYQEKLPKWKRITETRLLAGHPKIVRDKATGSVLEVISKKPHLPASIHNDWCDRKCQAVIAAYKKMYGEVV